MIEQISSFSCNLLTCLISQEQLFYHNTYQAQNPLCLYRKSLGFFRSYIKNGDGYAILSYDGKRDSRPNKLFLFVVRKDQVFSRDIGPIDDIATLIGT